MGMVLAVGAALLASTARVTVATNFYSDPYPETITGTSGDDEIRGAGSGLLSGGPGANDTFVNCEEFVYQPRSSPVAEGAEACATAILSLLEYGSYR